jgi:hypothetical protein
MQHRWSSNGLVIITTMSKIEVGFELNQRQHLSIALIRFIVWGDQQLQIRRGR